MLSALELDMTSSLPLSTSPKMLFICLQNRFSYFDFFSQTCAFRFPLGIVIALSDLFSAVFILRYPLIFIFLVSLVPSKYKLDIALRVSRANRETYISFFSSVVQRCIEILQDSSERVWQSICLGVFSGYCTVAFL